MLTTYLAVALVAYMLGSIPFGYILVKLFLKQDIRMTGSGNIGATNVARSGKKGLAIATLLLDAGKGFIAVLFPMYLLSSQIAAAIEERRRAQEMGFDFIGGPVRPPEQVLLAMCIAGLCAVLGHMFPVWLRFKGGKGVATAVGALMFISPRALMASLVIFVVVFLVFRFVSLGSVMAAIVFPIVAKLEWRAIPSTAVILICTVSLLIILKHHANIRRLLNGTEPKFGVKKPVPADPIQVEKNA